MSRGKKPSWAKNWRGHQFFDTADDHRKVADQVPFGTELDFNCTVVPDGSPLVIGAKARSIHRIGLLAIRYLRTDPGRKREQAYGKLVHAVAVHGGKHP